MRDRGLMRRLVWLSLLALPACYSECAIADERRAERCTERGGVYVETFDRQPPKDGRTEWQNVRFCARRDSIPLASPRTPTPARAATEARGDDRHP